MMKMTAFVALILMLAASGCMTPPPRENAWTSAIPAAEAAPRYGNLTAAVVYTANTKNALEYLRRSTYGQFDADAVFAGIFSSFDRDFKRATRAQSVEQAKASGADIVMVVDLYAALATTKFTTHKFDATVAVMTPGGAELDRLVVHSESRTSWTAVSRPLGIGVEQGTKDLGDQLEAKLLSSTKLQALASAAPGAPSPAVAAAPSVAALPSSPSPTFNAAERADDLAVVVGIESYSDIGSKAPYAERDADAFKAHVRALGVPERNIVLLKGPKAGRASIVKNIEQWLPRMAKPDSRVYFYFSGHGAPDVKTGLAYLVPWDGDPNFLESTAYPVAQLYKKLGELPAKQVLVAMDSCFSGAGGRSVLATGARPLVSKVETGSVSAKLTVLAASAANEISGSLDDKGHGAFTYFLLQALDSGKTTPKALVDYLTPRVQDEARRLNRDQTPQLSGDGSWPLR